MRFIGKIITTITGFIFIAIIVNVAVSNSHPIILKFFPFPPLSITLWIVILAVFAIGLICGAIAMMPSLLAAKFHARSLNSSIAKMEKQQRKEDEEKQALTTQ